MDNGETNGTQVASRPRVLIAEDYVLIQENIRKAISSWCDIVGTVEDGKSALAAAGAEHPDIVLLDVSLPGLGGFAVAEELIARNSGVKVIFVTAYGDRQYVQRAFEIGASGYVLKGTMWSELPEAIRAVAGGGSYRSALLS